MAAKDPDTIRLLLAHHVNEGAKTKAGETALDIAVRLNRCDNVQALEHGSQEKTLACLQTLVAMSQKNPDFLITTAIRAASAMNPPPPVPQEARRPYVEANTIFKAAQNESDTKQAISLYKEALSQAPWFAAAWNNLSLAQEKAGDYKAASESLNYFVKLEPAGTTDQAALDRVYALDAKAKMAAR
jgi:tetratricopeptide (TPR) repeat protein